MGVQVDQIKGLLIILKSFAEVQVGQKQDNP